MSATRVVMPNGTTRSFREGTPQAVIRRAQQDLLAEMRGSGEYDGIDLGPVDRASPKVVVADFMPSLSDVGRSVSGFLFGSPAQAQPVRQAPAGQPQRASEDALALNLPLL